MVQTWTIWSQILSPGISNGDAHGTSNDTAEGPRMAAHSATIPLVSLQTQWRQRYISAFFRLKNIVWVSLLNVSAWEPIYRFKTNNHWKPKHCIIYRQKKCDITILKTIISNACIWLKLYQLHNQRRHTHVSKTKLLVYQNFGYIQYIGKDFPKSDCQTNHMGKSTNHCQCK